MPNLTLSAGGLADVSVLSQINGAGFASAAINNTYTPLTIVVKVSLKRTTQPIAAEWVTSNGATMSTQFSSISAILVKDDSQTDQ
jgi:ABC-type enterochelin transport system ATPase subunit